MTQDPRTGPREPTEPDGDGLEQQGSVTLDLTRDDIRSVALLSEPEKATDQGSEQDVAPDVITPEVITTESWSDDPSNREPNADE